MKNKIRKLTAMLLTFSIFLTPLCGCVDQSLPQNDTDNTEPSDSPVSSDESTYITDVEIEHSYSGGYCIYCGASENLKYVFNRETQSMELRSAKSCTSELIVVASSYRGYPVTSIAPSAFFKLLTVKEVVIPDTVTQIGDNAFGESSIEKVTLPASLESMGNRCFSHCEFLKEIVIPQSLISLPEQAFEFCSSLKSVTLHQNIKHIGVYCFNLCTNLKTVIDFPNELTSAETGIFDLDSPFVTIYENCYYIGGPDNPYQILESVIDTFRNDTPIHPDTRIIAGAAFSNAFIHTVTIPESVVYIGSSAFANCKTLTDITVPDNVTYLGDSAFKSCPRLKNVTLSNSITEILSGTFYMCEALEVVKIPASVTTIGENSFSGCKQLKEVHVPISVKKIYNNVTFPNCNIYYEGTRDEWESINENVWQFEGCTLIAKDGTFRG